jgi:hypothetical protein
MEDFMSQRETRGMLGTLKKFDREEHSTYDSAGREAFKAYANKAFKDKGWKTIDNSNEHGIDLLTLNEKNEVVICWEIEVRHGNWQGDKPFPFREINCIERKDHQWRKDSSFTSKIPEKLAKSYLVYYVQLNKECSRAVIIRGDTILQYPLKPWANRKASGEYVRQVPIDKTTQIKL